MEQLINLGVKGHLLIEKIKNGIREVVYNDHNDILPNYKNIIRHSIAGDATHILDNINILKSSSLLASSPITQVEYTATTDNEVKFTAIFDEVSFNDTFDEILLSSTGGGDFSKVDGLSIAKDDQTQLSLSWTLKIINQ
tara:strand:- start:985 stop:1401 length:417 start_codon:yes stop_codon:yes gene_type:complete